MRKAHRSTAATATVEVIRRSLVALRRLFQRKELVELWASAFGRETKLDYTELRLLDAAGLAQGAGSPGGATVGELSRRLGVDPSRASRQVARAVARGLLERHPEQRDGRKVVLRVTRRGARLQQQGSDLTRARIALAVAGWAEADLARFAALFGRFTEGMLAEAPGVRRATRAPGRRPARGKPGRG